MARGAREGFLIVLSLASLAGLVLLLPALSLLDSALLRGAMLRTLLATTAIGAVGGALGSLILKKQRWASIGGAIAATLGMLLAVWSWSGWDGQNVGSFLAPGPVIGLHRLMGSLKTLAGFSAGIASGPFVFAFLARMTPGGRKVVLGTAPSLLMLALLAGGILGGPKPGHRVVLFGIDAVGRELLLDIAGRTALPNYERIFDEGGIDDLAVQPPFTPPSWTSIATGKFPEAHGIDNWNRVDRVAGTRYNLGRGDVQTPTVFEIAEFYGKKVILLDWPILGRNVPGLTVVDKARGMFLSFGSRLAYFVRQSAQMTVPNHDRVHLTAWETEVGLNILMQSLFRQFEPDLLGFVVRGTDTMQHAFFHSLDPEEFGMDPSVAAEQADYIPSMYRLSDRMIEEFLDDPYTDVIAVSDHGGRGIPTDRPVPFREAYKVLLGPFLEAWGYTVPNEDGTVDYAESQLHDCSDRFLHSMVCVNVTDVRCQAMGRGPDDLRESGRPVIEEVAERFASLRFVDTGEAVFPGEYTTLWNGRNMRSKLFVMDEGLPPAEFAIFDEYELDLGAGFWVTPFDDAFWSREVTDGTLRWRVDEFMESLHWQGNHHPDAFIGVHGPSFRRGALTPEARGVDITPTILHLLDLPVADDMAGRVLTELLDPASDAANRAPATVPTHEDKVPRWGAEGDGRYQKRMERDLKAVGYID